MNSLITTRKQLGLSQQTMAGILGSSRSRLSHAEAGSRLLEPHAMQQFALLLQKLHAPLQPDLVIPGSELLTWAIQDRQEALQFRLAVLRRQQKKLTQRLQQQTLLLHCLQVFDEPVPNGKHAAKQQRKTKLLRAAKEAQFELDNKATFFLELEIAALEFQLGYCRKFFEK